MVTASDDLNTIVWNLNVGAAIEILDVHDEFVQTVQFSPDGQYIASAGWGSSVIIHDADTFEVDRTFDGLAVPVLDLDYSPDGNRLAYTGGRSQDRVTIITLDSDESPSIIQTGDTAVSLEYSISGELLAVTGFQGISIWDVENNLIARLAGHDDLVTDVTFSPDGRYLVSSSRDNTLIVWDLNTFEPQTVLSGHNSNIETVTYSHDGHFIASGSANGHILIWNSESGLPILEIEAHSERVNELVFTPDGRSLISVSDDNTVKAWNITEIVENPLIWVMNSRYVPELDCDQRNLFAMAVGCDEEGNFATRTPFPTMTPTVTPMPSPTLDPQVITPTALSTSIPTEPSTSDAEIPRDVSELSFEVTVIDSIGDLQRTVESIRISEEVWERPEIIAPGPIYYYQVYGVAFDNRFISITQSESPFATLEEWKEANSIQVSTQSYQGIEVVATGNEEAIFVHFIKDSTFVTVIIVGFESELPTVMQYFLEVER